MLRAERAARAQQRDAAVRFANVLLAWPIVAMGARALGVLSARSWNNPCVRPRAGASDRVV
eukprot:1166905-Lingulodinium_polyedra.AAC.1